MEAVLEDYRSAPISERLRAMLTFLEKLTLTPEALTGEDAAAVLAAGISKEAALHAVYVAYLFNIYDRMADTLGFEIPADGYRMGRRILLTVGYR